MDGSRFLHFHDLMCGYFALSPLTAALEEDFKRVLEIFQVHPEARPLRCHRASHSAVYTTSVLEDFAENDGTSAALAACAVFVGYASGLTLVEPPRRKIAAHFLRASAWDLSLVNDFLDSRFSGAVIEARRCRLLTDYFGKRKIFYKQIGDALFFSSEFRPLCALRDPEEKIDRQALRDFLSFDAVCGDRTLSTKIKALPLQHYIEFDAQGLHLKSWGVDEGSSARRESPAPAAVYDKFKKVFSFFTRDLGYRHSDLTGGTDTRLNLAAARELGPALDFNFDSTQSEREEAAFYDHEVIKILQRRFDLKLHDYSPGPYCPNTRFSSSIFDHHRLFDSDMYNRTLSGMFGGEFLGGWSYENFLGSTHHERYEHSEAILEKAGDYWQGTQAPLREFQDFARTTAYADPSFLASLYLTYGSALFYRLGHPAWMEPHLLSNRKLSCFLADELLRSFNVVGISGVVRNYSFYKDIYRESLPEYLRIPFFSQIPRALEDKDLDIRTRVKFAGAAPTSEPRYSELEKKLDFLKEWAATSALGPLLLKDLRILQERI